MERKTLTGLELTYIIEQELKVATTEQIASIVGELGLYTIIDIDSIQDLITVEE